MKKKLIRFIALVLCPCLLLALPSALTAFAANADAEPSQEINYFTVPMRATVSILYAVPAAGYAVKGDGTVDGLELLIWKHAEGELGNAARIRSSGTLSINGVKHLIFVYNGLSAAEMDVKVCARASYNGKLGAPKTYSVADFAASYTGEYTALVNAMLQYGNAVKALQNDPVSVSAAIVNKNGAAGVLTLVSDDGDQRTADFFLTEIAPNYDAFRISIALPTYKVASLQRTEDGTAWKIDENGSYVLSILNNGYSSEFTDSIFYGDAAADYETMVDFWRAVEANAQISVASHSHTHKAWGLSDEITYNEDGSIKYPAGNVIKELVASAQILRDLIGSDSHVIMRPGGHTDLTSDYFYALTESDGTYIGMRSSNGAPPLLGVSDTQLKLNTVSKFKSPAERLRIATILVRGYEAAFNGDGSGFATTKDSTAAECIAAGISAWKNYIEGAIRTGGWASIGFHSVISDETKTTNNGYAVFDSQVKALMDYVQPLVEAGTLWLPSFDEATKYYFEWSSASLSAKAYGSDLIRVTLTDLESDPRVNVPLTVKVSVPDDWQGAVSELNGVRETLTVQSDDDGSFVYVNIVPDSGVVSLTPVQ